MLDHAADPTVCLVQSVWLEECLSQQKRLPEGSHLYDVGAALSRRTEGDLVVCFPKLQPRQPSLETALGTFAVPPVIAIPLNIHLHAAEDVEARRRSGPMRKYEKWLGQWRPEYDLIKNETELVLMVSHGICSHTSVQHTLDASARAAHPCANTSLIGERGGKRCFT